jgi:hypothetical protein
MKSEDMEEHLKAGKERTKKKELTSKISFQLGRQVGHEDLAREENLDIERQARHLGESMAMSGKE